MSSVKNEPLVSVMMPAFNVATHLPAALDSLISQTYQNWEAAVVDDGSTDATADVLRKYASRDLRIRPVLAQHAGRGAARNLSLRHCNGEFIALLDADDVATDDRLSQQVTFLTANPDFGGVSGQCVSFADAPVLDMRKLMPWPTDPEAIRAGLLGGRMHILNGGAMLRKSVFDRHGDYRVELLRAQDYEFFRRLAVAGVRLGALPEVVLLYRQERLIPRMSYFVESESFKHFANAMHAGYRGDYAEFQASIKGRTLGVLTRMQYAYLFAKLAVRYRGLR
jgi:glycosyltransferase involved in cell wall biosynthesis